MRMELKAKKLKTQISFLKTEADLAWSGKNVQFSKLESMAEECKLDRGVRLFVE